MAIFIRVKLMGCSTISKFIALVCFQGFIYPYLQSLNTLPVSIFIILFDMIQ